MLTGALPYPRLVQGRGGEAHAYSRDATVCEALHSGRHLAESVH